VRATSIVGLLILSGVTGYITVGSADARGDHAALFVPPSPIKHIVVLTMENHAYDSYFGNYCQSISTYCSSTGNGIPNGTCVPYYPNNPGKGCVVPYNFTLKQLSPHDMGHGWQNGAADYNRGAMNGFYGGEANGIIPFGHYNGTTATTYWDLAEEYSLGDNFFAPVLDYSDPNHWYMIAGQAPAISLMSYLTSPADQNTYRTEANSTRTIQDVFNGTNVSWDYYDYTLRSYSAATALPHNATGSAYNYWDPMAGRYESYTTHYKTHFQNRPSFFSAAAAGTLPDVSWVIPASNESDHPNANISEGQKFVASVVNAIENSPDWNSTALFITWDEWGGFYDHVAPPTFGFGNAGVGFRVPLLVVSPYSKENYISNSFGTFDSILAFIEWQFGLGCVGATTADCTAPLPLDYFNFTQSPRAPITFPETFVGSEHYPVELQTTARENLCGRSCASPYWTIGSDNLTDPDID
jgi:phospholipase C